MRKQYRKEGPVYMAAVAMLCLLCSVKGEAAEMAADNSAVSVTLPVAAETDDSPFDFILDPYGLVSGTKAMRYGGGSVEEGATLLFFNQEGTYDFSKDSDRLRVVNQTPVEITVSASVSDLGELAIMEDRDFSGSDICGFYLALVDDQGNELTLSADEEVSVSQFMEPGSHSFGLTGACNPDADWQDLSVHPRVTVTWHVEPVVTEEEEHVLAEEKEEEPEAGENTVQELTGEKGGLDDEKPAETPDQEENGGDEDAMIPEEGEPEHAPEMNPSGEDMPETAGDAAQEPAEGEGDLEERESDEGVEQEEDGSVKSNKWEMEL